MDAAFIASWLAFASAHAGLPIPALPSPHIQLVDRVSRPDWLADTDGVTGNIRVRIGLGGIDQACYSAHELTHFLQFANSRQITEPPAYRVQAACYRAFGAFGKAAWAEWMAGQLQ